MKSFGKKLLRLAAAFLPLALGACQTLMEPLGHGSPEDELVGQTSVPEPGSYKSASMHALACDLDYVERQIDWHGSVTAKVPDVWGQPRLTLYRELFEEQIAKDLEGFKESLQGSIARSDQAFASSSTALAAAFSGGTAVQTIPAGTTVSGTPTTHTTQTVVNVPGTTGGTPPAPLAGASAGNFATSTVPTLPANFSQPYSQTGTALQLTLEPTEYLLQKQRYLNLLAQIRRTNEGDDTADAPGYALNLMRIPVSVLPGKRTYSGHGAEITMTLSPVLDEDLLPTTFRKLVINNVANQLGFPITQMFNLSIRSTLPKDQQPINQLLADRNKLIIETETALSDYLAQSDYTAARALVDRLSPLELKIMKIALPDDDKAVIQAVKDKTDRGVYGKPLKATSEGIYFPTDTELANNAADNKNPADQKKTPPKQQLSSNFSGLVPAFAPGTDANSGLPVSQIVDVYGQTYSFEIAYAVSQTLSPVFKEYGYAHLPDVRGYLKEELNAAYDMLSNPMNHVLWEFCSPNLVALVRTQNLDQLDELRRSFRRALATLAHSRPDNFNNRTPIQLSKTAAYAWAILVDAALLTDKMCKEMKGLAKRNGTCIPGAADWLPLYQPSPEVCRTFNAYVQVRWPIHVFALDPDVQEQNLNDQLYTRREFQFALSLAFASGQMNFNQLTQFARRVEAQYQTIDLNRTQVGFGNGPDTFGWRFYPRYQTPDTPGNFTLLFRDLLMGGPNRNQLLRGRKLEPGPRECVALVIMPSFVPVVSLDTTANFFGLTNPKHKVFDHTDEVDLGKTIKAITTTGCAVKDAEKFRNGEPERLMARAKQLSDRLPMQSVMFPVPTEDSLGGFELFGTSTTNLAPALYGWYGAPGVDSKKPTTLFLVGDHFSALRTRVIAGNKQVGKVTMLSRQVIRVDFGPDAIPLALPDQAYLTLHVGTPYGVSRELLVPVKNSDKITPDGYYLTAETQTLEITLNSTNGNAPFTVSTINPNAIGIRGVFANGLSPTQISLTLNFGDKSIPFTLKSFDGTTLIQPSINQNGVYFVPQLTTATNINASLNALIAQLQSNGMPVKDVASLYQAMPTTASISVTPSATQSQTVATPMLVNGNLIIKVKVNPPPPTPPTTTPPPKQMSQAPVPATPGEITQAPFLPVVVQPNGVGTPAVNSTVSAPAIAQASHSLPPVPTIPITPIPAVPQVSGATDTQNPQWLRAGQK